MKRNAIHNLSAIRQSKEIFLKHICDSLMIVNLLQNSGIEFLDGDSYLDVGTGGGFPLLPIAIKFPFLHCIGLDSKRKKVTAVNEIVTELHIPNVRCIRSRIEDHTEQHKRITVRSVAYIDKLLPLVFPVIQSSGFLILYKQYTAQEHSSVIEHCRNTNHLVLRSSYSYNLPKLHDKITLGSGGEKNRILYLIQKL